MKNYKIITLIFSGIFMIILVGCNTNSIQNKGEVKVIDTITYLKIIQKPTDSTHKIDPSFLTFWETKDAGKIQQIYTTTTNLPKATYARSEMCPVAARNNPSVLPGYYDFQFFRSIADKNPSFSFAVHGFCPTGVWITDNDYRYFAGSYWNDLANIINIPRTSLVY